MKTTISGLLLAGSLLLTFTYHAAAKNPPGTVRVKFNHTTVFVDKMPITNLDWLEYLWYAKNVDSIPDAQIQVFLPDTTRFTTYNDFAKEAVANKKDFVCCMSNEKKIAYAQWRTERVNALSLIRRKHPSNIVYEVLTIDELDEICKQNKKIQRLANEEQYIRCIVRKVSNH